MVVDLLLRGWEDPSVATFPGHDFFLGERRARELHSELWLVVVSKTFWENGCAPPSSPHPPSLSWSVVQRRSLESVRGEA